ncbi:23S rRNA (uracil(1939)-C(5))-methyltransferase RlmD [Vulcanococcus limneticus Candia 3F8]|uniref:23S rRNA (uracil(1939)-C(5))-methyltransferase RlmD n=1 Tax=Vulcanococcus limneticus TaxID=2170428 RepID=UPI000B97CF65|nr:23S rRNA (uracil(1939)-C(5))-methyltransferase RlmD [Vulcanococcus limneticus]MCP9792807.1 23S rRNA (uracil(1939)-C(5))-methyltransferase RlmD [Vulcanococcus limneticus MW73D5]MCP9894812.1 23S rRNA (uracil(1939)-C(5))-methyltransferase RlmD [Vulcanococcus limneticus Candia 3F8]MCP9898266.1 23S rRNA (uracil(1939)-C(5))-methyltransferase RlmD [Vulcanococcus limneticus Candia 3B3]
MPASPCKLGERLDLTIDGLGHDGQGVGRWQGLAVFVPGTLPGEVVAVRVRRIAKRHLEADLIGVEQPAPERRKPACILAEKCGGCSLQHASDDGQARWKQDLVQQTLRRLGGFEAPLRPLLSSARTLGYRNRALIPLERTEDGLLRAGYYRRGSHKIVNLNRCPVLDPRIDGLIEPIKADLEETGWPVDVNLSGGGGLRHLALRVGHHSGEVLITLVSSHAELDGLHDLAERWRASWPEVVGVCLNLQPRASNAVMGPQTLTLSGRGWLAERFAGQELRIGADTFFQVNTEQAERVVPLLLEAFGALERQNIVDAYCGIGTFSLPLAAHGAHVIGLESHAASVEQARANAQRNGLERATFHQTDVEAMLAEHLVHADGLLVDPPRKGLSPAALAAIQAAPPKRVVYISCNPATLARDLALLTAETSLELRWIQPVDFFPQTSHVEAVAVLERS